MTRLLPTSTTQRLIRMSVLLLIVSSTVVAIAENPKTRAPKDSDGQLQWKFKKGQAFKLDIEQTQKLTMNIAGQEIQTDTVSVTEMAMDVKEVDNEGIASAVNIIKRMKISTKAPGTTIEYDSASDKKPEGISVEIAKIMKPMIGQEIKQKMRPSGKVFDVEVPDAMLAGVKEANPMMASMFSKETFEEMSSKASLEFPASKLDVGHVWQVKAEMKMGPSVVRTVTDYKYMGVADVDGKPMHLIGGTVKMSFPDGINGVDIKISKESSTVAFYFDGLRGRLTKSLLDQDVTMAIETGGQTINQRLEQKMEMKFNEVE